MLVSPVVLVSSVRGSWHQVRRIRSQVEQKKMVDNSTSSPQGDVFAALGVNARTALIVLHVTALPLGVFFEMFLIMRLLKKTKKRLWDALTMALEANQFLTQWPVHKIHQKLSSITVLLPLIWMIWIICTLS